MGYLRLSGLLGCFASAALEIGFTAALVGAGVLMVSEYPLLLVGPLEAAAFVFWVVIGSFAASIEDRLPLETRYDPPERLARRYPARSARLSLLLGVYQVYQVVVIALVIVVVKQWLDHVAVYAVYNGW